MPNTQMVAHQLPTNHKEKESPEPDEITTVEYFPADPRRPSASQSQSVDDGGQSRRRKSAAPSKPITIQTVTEKATEKATAVFSSIEVPPGPALRKSALSRTRTTVLHTTKNTWLLEKVGLVVSIFAFLAIIAILPVYSNQPLASWTFRVSLNTVVSILGATSRASLAFAIGTCMSQSKWIWYKRKDDSIMAFDHFEEASRGPWGSARLLMRTNLRHWVSVGALTIVVLLGFEPFLQAVIVFTGKEIESRQLNITASIGRSKRLDIGTYTGQVGFWQDIEIPGTSLKISTTTVNIQRDYSALAPITIGLSGRNTIENQRPEFTCASGNCTWPSHASLAVCDACQDVTSHLVPFSFNESYAGSAANVDRSRNHSFTRFELQERSVNISNWDDLIIPYMTQMTVNTTSRPGDTISFKDYKTLLVSFAIIQAGDDFRLGKATWRDTNVTALECALFFCVKAYKTDVRQGILTESVLGSYLDRNMDSFLSASLPDSGYDPSTFVNTTRYPNVTRFPRQSNTEEATKAYDNLTTYTLGPGSPFPRTDLQLLFPRDEYDKLIGLGSPDDDLKFNISHAATESIIAALWGLFVRGGASSAKSLAAAGVHGTELLYYPTPWWVAGQPPAIFSLGASRNLTATFEAVAASLTKWIRDLGLKDSAVRGSTREWVVHIQVRWAFLGYPVAALLGGCVFCALAMLETRRLGLPTWKGSALAGLAHGLDTESRSKLRAADRISYMIDHAKATRVRFTEAEDGPELTLVDVEEEERVTHEKR